MKYCPKCGIFINANVCSCGWSTNSQIIPKSGKKPRTKIVVIIIASIGSIAVGFAFMESGTFILITLGVFGLFGLLIYYVMLPIWRNILSRPG